MVRVEWQGAMTFQAMPPSGRVLLLDSDPDPEGTGVGPTPMETLLAAVAACSGMDVISILEKKRQNVSSYRIEIEGTRPPQGDWPRPYLSFSIRHILNGKGLDPAAVQRAIELSDEKYCSVLATLRESPKIASEWRIED